LRAREGNPQAFLGIPT